MFKDVEFGDAFKTQCGEKAVYWHKTMMGYHVLVTKDGRIVVDNKGKAKKEKRALVVGGGFFAKKKPIHKCDVIGKWGE